MYIAVLMLICLVIRAVGVERAAREPFHVYVILSLEMRSRQVLRDVIILYEQLKILSIDL